jgi:hypothetical protein
VGAHRVRGTRCRPARHLAGPPAGRGVTPRIARASLRVRQARLPGFPGSARLPRGRRLASRTRV